VPPPIARPREPEPRPASRNPSAALTVDRAGPGGVWILSPAGKHLGTIRGPELPANFAWGDADARTLYLTARTGLYRIRLVASGIRR
jgi:sugar lactone lactonase YvrE